MLLDRRQVAHAGDVAARLLMSATSLAPSGSVTAVKTTGMSFVAVTTACADGVEIGTITRVLADELLGDLHGGAGIALRALIDELEVLAFLVAGGLQLSRTPSRQASSAGCSTMAVTATKASAAAAGQAKESPPASPCGGQQNARDHVGNPPQNI